MAATGFSARAAGRALGLGSGNNGKNNRQSTIEKLSNHSIRLTVLIMGYMKMTIPASSEILPRHLPTIVQPDKESLDTVQLCSKPYSLSCRFTSPEAIAASV